jgi:hypothetical protein
MICFVNYHAVVKPMERPVPRVNFQPFPKLPAATPPHYNYTSTPVRTAPAPSRWPFPAPPMPQPPSVRINPPQGPVYWGPYDQRRAWRDDRARDNDDE